MATTLYIFKILFLLTAVLTKLSLCYENSRCSDFGTWQSGCAGPGTVACDVATESGAYCISRCYNNACSQSQDAARDFKKYICNTYGFSADFVMTNGEVDLAIHRNKSPSCGTYNNQFNSVPYAQSYPETQRPPNDRIPK